MSEGLEALNKLVSHIETEYHSDDYYECKNAKDTIEKELKALEIIKKKGIDTIVFNNLHDYDEYLKYCELSEAFRSLFDYTKEKFDLLKEVLE